MPDQVAVFLKTPMSLPSPMTIEPTDQKPNDLQTLLQTPAQGPWWRKRTLWLALGLIVGSAGAYYSWDQNRQKNAVPSYVTEVASKGNLTLIVTANGTLQPTRAVNIGSELSGTVRRVMVDVNDQV